MHTQDFLNVKLCHLSNISTKQIQRKHRYVISHALISRRLIRQPKPGTKGSGGGLWTCNDFVSPRLSCSLSQKCLSGSLEWEVCERDREREEGRGGWSEGRGGWSERRVLRRCKWDRRGVGGRAVSLLSVHITSLQSSMAHGWVPEGWES